MKYDTRKYAKLFVAIVHEKGRIMRMNVFKYKIPYLGGGRLFTFKTTVANTTYNTTMNSVDDMVGWSFKRSKLFIFSYDHDEKIIL